MRFGNGRRRETAAVLLEQYAEDLSAYSRDLERLDARPGTPDRNALRDLDERRRAVLIAQPSAERAFQAAGMPTDLPYLPRCGETRSNSLDARETHEAGVPSDPFSGINSTLDRAHIAVGRLRDPEWEPRARVMTAEPTGQPPRLVSEKTSRFKRLLFWTGSTLEKIGKTAGYTVGIAACGKMFGAW